MKKILLILTVLIAVVFIGGFAYLYHVKTKSLPNYSEDIQLKGITDEIEVIRDQQGIPHIYAKNEKDLYMAVGYVMAQDRMWQMDLLRRVTTGRLSEIFGEKTVKADLLMRALQMPKKSAMILDSLAPEIRQSLEYFANGVNQYLQNNKDNLPPEFTILGYEPEKWEAIHSVNLIGYMAWDLTSGWKNEFMLRKLINKAGQNAKSFIPDLNKQKELVFPDFKLDSAFLEINTELLDQSAMLEEVGASVFFGSNNWAVSGKKSETGHPIMANDMHLGLFAPGIWYQMHTVIEGQLNVTGVALPGAPTIVAGHNEHIAWGMTNVMLDETDFYKESVNPENENQYKLDGKWIDFKISKEVIKIKDAEQQEHTLKFTHRGPVVSQFKNVADQTISMNWVGTRYSNELRSLYLLNRAKNWTDFREAVKTFVAVSQNIIYSDVEGNIGLQTCAGLAIREGNPIGIYPGDTSLYDWKGFVPFEELPFTYNPECGYVASANNRTVNEAYPHYISNWFIQPYRYSRIVEMLEEKEKLSVEDFKKMQGDHKSHLVLIYQADIISYAEKINKMTKNEQIALDSLKAWNAVMSKDGISATFFEQFVIKFIENTISDELGNDLADDFLGYKIMLRSFMENTWKRENDSWFDNVLTSDKKETFSDIFQKSFKDAVAELEKKYGNKPNSWLWGNVHQITLKHPIGKIDILDKLFNLNRGPYAVGGSSHTVSPYSYSLKGEFNEVTHGASHRHIYLPNNWDASQTIIPTGISGIPASEYYCNQTEMYIDNVYHEDFITRTKVEEAGVFVMKFLK